MRRALILLSVAVILLVAAAQLYRDPRVQDLFRTVPRAGAARRPAAQPAASASLEQPTRAATPVSSTPAVKNPARVREHEVASAQLNQTPNETVSRVLLQVLAAKGLANGIALEVTDESVRVFGEVDSDDIRQKILDLIQKGREGRRLDGAGLTIRR